VSEDYENCAGRTFYRVVGQEPPTVHDFLSYRDLARPQFDPSPEGYENWIGVSVYERRRQAIALARYLARRQRPAGTLVAELVIPADLPIQGKRMGGVGHFNLFPDAATLLACYNRIVADLSHRPEG
jgi:hypothetical protein